MISPFTSLGHFHISHNAPYLLLKILHNFCFSFLLCITAVLRETQNSAYAFFWAGGRVKYGALWEMWKLRIGPNTLTFKTRLSAKPPPSENEFHLHENEIIFISIASPRWFVCH